MTIHVVDAADSRLDDYRSLNDQAFRRRYEADRCFIVEGYVPIDRLVESGHTIRSVLLAPSRLDRFADHVELLTAASVPVYIADRGLIADVVGFDLHRGVIACADRRPHPSVGDLVVGTHRIAVLEGLNDAENLGAIARAARAFGIDGIIIDARCTDPYSRRTVRVSMGEVLTLPIARTDEYNDVADRLCAVGFEVWAMTPAADADDIWALAVPERLAVCLGAEGPGLSRTVLSRADRRVRIPISASVDSINVAQAAAVTFAATTRTRDAGPADPASPV